MFRKKSKQMLTALAFVLLFYGTSHASQPKFPLLWTVKLNTLLESAPTVADVNADGRDEVVIAGMEELFVLGKNGQTLWHWRTRKRFSTYPAVLLRPGKPALLFAADNSGLLTCLDGTGHRVWQRELDAPTSWSAPVVFQKKPGGNFCLIQTDESGAVWAFRALTGEVLWKSKVPGKPASPAVGDVTGDGLPEIAVTTTAGILTLLRSDGHLLWKKKIGGPCASWATSSPVIFSISGHRTAIVAASSDGTLFCLNPNGTVRWNYPTGEPIASTLSVADFDGNGRADIFVVTQLGRLFRFDETGQVLWNIDTQGRSLAPGAIVDVTGDGKLEYLLCTQRGHLMVFNASGAMIFEHQFDNRTINVTPTFGDVTGSKKDLEFVVTGGESGRVFCFGTPASVSARRPWPAYRVTPQNSGSWFGLQSRTALRMVPRNLTWNHLLVGEPVRFDSENPAPKRRMLKAVAVCYYPDGQKQQVSGQIIGKRGVLELPVHFVVPGVYRFSWWLENARGKTLVSGKRTVTVQPFANDRALWKRALHVLESTAQRVDAKLPLSAAALRQEREAFWQQQQELLPRQKAVPVASPETVHQVLIETAALNRRVKRALTLSRVVAQAARLGKNTSLVVFEGSLWDSRESARRLPDRVENPLQISRAVVPGEHQPVSLRVLNLTNRPLTVRAVVTQVDSGLTIRLLHAVASPTSLGELSWDALPELNNAHVFTVPPLRSQELWVDVAIGEMARGRRTFSLYLKALNGAGVLKVPANAHAVPPPTATVSVTLDVLPFQMAPPGAFRLCTWSPSEGPDIPDLLAHGNNVFLVPHGTIQSDSTGRVLRVDFSRLDRLIQNFAGQDVVFLVNGFPRLTPPFGSTAYRRALKHYLERMVSHLKGRGIDTVHFVLYPLDEPGGHGWKAVHRLVAFGKMVHAVNPAIRLYMDGGGDVGMIRAMASVVRVWTPPLDWLGQKLPEMDVIRKTGGTLWSYNCSYGFSRPVGANLKNTHVVGEYRNAALFALRHGARGIGFWCYAATRGDLWERVQSEYNLVYPGESHSVDSRRWEAVREGIEDARILLALKNYWEKHAKNPAARKACTRIQHLFEVDLPQLVDPGFQAMKLGLSRTTLDAVSNESMVQAFRQNMLDCVRLVIKE